MDQHTRLLSLLVHSYLGWPKNQDDVRFAEEWLKVNDLHPDHPHAIPVVEDVLPIEEEPLSDDDSVNSEEEEEDNAFKL